jgi:hypothetical protein
MPAAIFLASSLVTRLAAARLPGSGGKSVTENLRVR